MYGPRPPAPSILGPSNFLFPFPPLFTPHHSSLSPAGGVMIPPPFPHKILIQLGLGRCSFLVLPSFLPDRVGRSAAFITFITALPNPPIHRDNGERRKDGSMLRRSADDEKGSGQIWPNVHIHPLFSAAAPSPQIIVYLRLLLLALSLSLLSLHFPHTISFLFVPFLPLSQRAHLCCANAILSEKR